MSTTAQLAPTPLRDWHVRQGGRMVDFAGWEMPVQYTSIVEEHQATRRAAGLFDISHMGRLAITGPDTARFLDCLLTRRIDDMRPGQIRYSLVCNAEGGILDDVLVYRPDASRSSEENGPVYTMVVNASNRQKIVAWLKDRAIEFAVRVVDDTTRSAMFAIQGPQAVVTVDGLTGGAVTSLRYYHGTEATLDGIDCYLSRTGYTGEDGCEVITAADQAANVWQSLFAAVDRVGGRACGLGARDTLRLEAGMPLYGHELSEQINPIQAGLKFAVTLEGRDFIGREAIQAALQDDSQPVRIGLKLEGRRAAREGCEIVQGEATVGQVTSGSYSPTLERPIAMGYVRPTASTVGAKLAVDIRGREHPAVVVPLPFYQRGK